MANLRKEFLSVVILSLATLVPCNTQGQEALVLSGGGSRGLAHIGVIVGLDSLHHDPDLIIGVSMGAIVGSLYAAGYKPAEIWDIADKQDWRDLFMPMPLVLGPQHTIRLPTLQWAVELGRFEFSRGVLPDWRLNRRLVAYLFDAAARARGDFDRLPRRYRAVAADRSDGDTVVISRGDLARSVRASMAEPGLFSPVLWNGRVLIDGGVADYLPVEIARNHGASTVTASDVVRSELKGTPRDPFGLVSRALTLLIIRARQDTTRPEYLVVPEIEPGQSGFSYPDDVEPMMRLGLKAVLAVVPRSQRSSHPARIRRAPPDSLRRLVIETPDSSLAALARAVFRSAAPARYSAAQVLRAVDRMYASGFTESVWPSVDSTDALLVHIDPRPSGSLDAGLGYDNDLGGRAWASAQRRFGRIGAPLEFDLAGSVTSVERWGSFSFRRASLWLPPVIWSAGASWREADVRFLRVAGENFTREVRRTGGWLGAERRAVFPDHIFTASFQVERIVESDTNAMSFGPLLRFDVPEPSRIVGLPFGLEVERRFGGRGYSRAALRGSLGTDGSALKFALVGDASITEKGAPADVLPALGDDRAMPGMRWGEERGRARIVGGFDVAYPIILGGHARVRARAGAAPLELRDFDASHSWVVGSEIGGVWSLPIGSIIVAVGSNGRGRSRFDIVAGQLF